MKLNELTKDEKSLLLFLESCAVDASGKIYTAKMNADDLHTLRKWNNSKFIISNEIPTEFTIRRAYWCVLSDEAFKLAHEERKNRAHRLLKKTKWDITIGE